jgi:hypothetical protein
MISRLIPIMCLAILLAGGFGSAQAQNAAVDSLDTEAIQEVIAGQMEAFARDDGEAAFAFAAPAIREKLGDAVHFMAMVKSGYAAVYRSRKVTFGELVAHQSHLSVQRVYVVGSDARLLAFDYVMERQAGGEWRIAGVYLYRAPGDGST